MGGYAGVKHTAKEIVNKGFKTKDEANKKSLFETKVPESPRFEEKDFPSLAESEEKAEKTKKDYKTTSKRITL